MIEAILMVLACYVFGLGAGYLLEYNKHIMILFVLFGGSLLLVILSSVINDVSSNITLTFFEILYGFVGIITYFVGCYHGTKLYKHEIKDER